MGYFRYDIKIRFSEVGIDNRLTPKGFLKYLQEIAIMHSDTLGYGVGSMTQNNLAWVITNWKVKLLSKPTTGTNITIKTWVRSFAKFFAYRDFEITDSNGNIIGIATSKWVLFDLTTRSITRVPDKMAEDYAPIDKQVFNEKIIEKLKSNLEHNTFNYTVQRRDLDTNKHVNNLIYLDYALETLPDDIYFNENFENIEICYKKEIVYKDNIKCFYSFEDNKHIITITNEDTSLIHSIIHLY